jgi:hypothetical protein
MFSCQYGLSGKTGWASFLNRMFRFAKPECSVLTDRTYASLDLIVVNLVSCASRITCSHTPFIAPHRCIDIEGALLDFS